MNRDHCRAAVSVLHEVMTATNPNDDEAGTHERPDYVLARQLW